MISVDPAHNIELTEDALRQLEKRRCEALIAADVDQLDALTDNDFLYQHGTGARQAKAEYLDLISKGEYRYLAIEPSNEYIFIHGPVAVIVATLAFRVMTNGTSFSTTRRATLIWRWRDGRWQFCAYQGCIPASEDVRLEEAAREPETVKRSMESSGHHGAETGATGAE